MDLKKLNEEIEKVLINKEIEKLKELLNQDKEVMVEGDTEVTNGSWDGHDPTTYSLDVKDGRFECSVYVSEISTNNWGYEIYGDILEKVYIGKDEDGYPDFDYESHSSIHEEAQDFSSKEEAINSVVNYFENIGTIDDVREA